MTEENNIEQEISDKFYEYSKNYDIHKWHDFIDKIDLSGLKSTLIIIDIDFSLDLENWNLEQLNFEFIIKKNYNINFQNCSFNSLNIISWDNILLNDLVINRCNFKGDVKINIKSQATISLCNSKFHGNKCIINYYTKNSPNQKFISLTNTQFGNPEAVNKNDFELQIFSENASILSSTNPNEWTQFSANNFILKTNLNKILFQQYKFNVHKFVIEGVKGKASNVSFSFHQSGISDIAEYTKEIEFKNLNEIKYFHWKTTHNDRKKLYFENVTKIEVSTLQNIDLHGSVKSIDDGLISDGQFFDCNFKNISGEINANIFGETTFENCQNIKKITAKEVHKITIESSTISEEIYLKNCDLLKIENSEINKIILENCQFNDAIILNGVAFSQSPHISNIKFSSHNVEMRNLKFEDNLSPQASGSYRALIKVCQDAGYENGVIFFHAKELETRHNYLKNNIKKFKNFSIFDDFIETFLLFFYNYFSKYGASLFRPLFWIFSFFITFFIYFVLFNNGEFDLFFSLIDLSKLSLKNSLGPLIFALPRGFIEEEFLTTLPSSIKILCFLQTVICSSIWFVWFFMVRRRFKI